MRKELTVYVNMIEKGEEFSISSVTKNREFIIINSGGNKFTANVKDLQEALNALEEFNKDNVQEAVQDDRNSIVISYGDE